MRTFHPSKFLIPTGLGGLGIIPFAYFQYTTKHPKGLVALEHLGHGSLSFGQEVLFRSLEGAMILFTLLHFFFMVRYLKQFFQWRKTDEALKMGNNPAANAALMTPFLAGFMSFNVLIAPVRFFIPEMHHNLTQIVPYAFGAWAIVWVMALKTEMKLLASSFKGKFDMEALNFGWLMHSFALGMGATVGSGISIFAAKGTFLPDLAAVMTFIIALLGGFLFLVKTFSLFLGQYRKEGLPANAAMPTFMIVMPIVTLYSITFFRLGHYLHSHHGIHVSKAFDWAVIMGGWSFQAWYLVFGLALLGSYLKNHFRKEYSLSQWGLICPFAAFAVLSALASKQIPSLAFPFSALSILSLVGGGVLFFVLLKKHNRCAKNTKTLTCS